MTTTRVLLFLILVSIILSMYSRPLAAGAVTQNDVSQANNAIQTAFVSIQRAENIGGNISSLVMQLNNAIQLVSKSEAENNSNPIQAAADLQSAIRDAQAVSSESNSAAQSGAAVKQMTTVRSIASAFLVIAGATLIGLFGDQIYRRIWFRLYEDHLVKRADD
jgi:hypothetical protein